MASDWRWPTPTTNSSYTVDLSWENSWALYTVFPLSAIGFSAVYLLGPRFWPLTPIAERYQAMSELNKMCWRQNCNAMVHSVTCTLMLIIAIGIDEELIRERPLHTHYNAVGYAAMCFSMGYFTFAIPWTYRLYFCKGERVATNLSLAIHHGVVWVACLCYNLSRTCGLYGAVAFACMEFTNWFFIACILFDQLRSKRYWLKNACYAMLVIAFIVCRVVICTIMMVLFTIDLSKFDSEHRGEWFFVLFQYLIFLFVWLLSFYFGLKEVHQMIKQQRKAKAKAKKPPSVTTSTTPSGPEGKVMTVNNV